MADAPIAGAEQRRSAGRRFVQVDGLRAIAALAVVGTHAYSQTNAATAASARLTVGVSIFFVISGFLLYRPFVAARLEGRDPRRYDYAVRRVLRIVPAYWVALIVLAVWPGLRGVLGSDFYAYFGFLQIYDAEWASGGIPIAWSLCIEVTFYAFLPLYALAIARLARDRDDVRVEVLGLVALCVVAALFRSALVWDDNRHPGLWLSLLGRFDAFAPGMAMAVVSVHLARRPPGVPAPRAVRFVERRPGVVWLAAAVAFLALTAAPIYPFTGLRGLHVEAYLYVLVASLLVLPAAIGDHAGGGVRRFLGARWMVFLGTVSYGIYLYHWPIVDRIGERVLADGKVGATAATQTWILGGAIAILLGWLSWRLVEAPAQTLGRRLTARRWGGTAVGTRAPGKVGEEGLEPPTSRV